MLVAECICHKDDWKAHSEKRFVKITQKTHWRLTR